MQFNSSKIKPVYWVISGLVLTIIAYFPIFNTAFVNWDDDIYIVLNNLIRSFSLENIKSWFSNSFLGLYQPLTLLSLSIDYSINGLDPRVFHSTNLLLHLCNTLLVYFFSKQLFGNTTIALMVMFLFGLHPLHVESVVWATERKDVLYSFFYLSALNLYLKYDTRKNNGSYLMVFVVFLLALLSKATAVTFPIALVLIDYVKNDKILSWKTFKNKVPFFTAALLFGIFTLYIHRSFGSLTNASEYSIFERGFFAIKGLWFFLSRTIWPIELTVYHPLPESISSWGIIESCIYFLLFTLAVIMLIRTSSKALKFGAAFFVLTLVLFLVPPGVPVLASERYYYLPSIGIFIMISALIAPYLNKTRLLKILSLSFFVLFLIILVFRTHQQAGVWQNSLSLWDHAIKVHGESHLSLLHRGKAYKQLKQYDPSLADLNRSIELNSGYAALVLPTGVLTNLTQPCII